MTMHKAYSIRLLRTLILVSALILCLVTSCDNRYDAMEERELLKDSHPSDIQEETDSSSNRSESAENNMLVNGGLEKWVFSNSYDMPEGWFCHNNYNVRKNYEVVYEGKTSAKMQSREAGATARIDQRIGVVPSHKIRIRFHYYVEQWKSKGARMYCYFRTASAEQYNIPVDELKAFYDTNTYYIIRGGGYGLSYFPHELNCWQTFDETIEVPATANYFVFGINSYYGTAIYIDDCCIYDVTEQITTGIREIYN